MAELMVLPAADEVFLRRDAIAAGYSDREIARLVASGVWHRLRHGAFVAGETWRSRDDAGRHRLLSRAVMKQARTAVVLSHLSAVAEYDGPMWDVPLDVVHVTRRDRRAGRKEAGVQQHQGVLAPEDVVELNGLDVTSATRTAIDLTTVAPVEQSLVVVNHLLHHGWTTLEQLHQRYETMLRHPFTLRTELVLRLADPRIESVGESRAFLMMWRQRLPMPVLQLVITDTFGRDVARLDFAWPDRGRWLEFDGKQKYLKHLRNGETVTDAVLREKRREDLICELTGWRCMRITWADLYDPERLAMRIRTFLGC